MGTQQPPSSPPIVGPTKPHHLADAVTALEESYLPRLPTYF